jgi:hypothetical protein
MIRNGTPKRLGEISVSLPPCTLRISQSRLELRLHSEKPQLWYSLLKLFIAIFFLFESPFICKLYRYIQQMV